MFNLAPVFAASIVYAIGAAFDWDGQAVILALPFSVLVWFLTPVVIVVNMLDFIRNRRRDTAILLLFAIAQTIALLRLANHS